jgi:L-fuculose-phosphate aldolase
MTEGALRESLAHTARQLHARGWVANHDGNVTARLDDGRLLATPGARSKADLTADDLIVVDLEGHLLEGPPGAKSFSELGLHLTAYAERGDVRAVVHAHPPSATAFACAGRPLSPAVIAEAVVSLGPDLPLVAFATPGPAACAAIRPHLAGSDVLLMESHGLLSLGVDLEQAYLRAELCEHLARIQLAAIALGGARPIPSSALGPLLEARKKAGLGPEARAALAAERSSPQAPAPPLPAVQVVACGPAPAGATVQTRSPGDAGDDELVRLVREEIVRALR